ncbi:phosphatase [Vibrio cidicii]|uniref:Phosphatase n=1 Tax=Vibrio cidicii TaxID=1763883 RepID=A0ABR5W374_9VIBR|nr:HAD-IA family hydrolase [Vibrio cidicii]KYN83372.1 phosphatase [Vibrio cidicii]KYN85219.1 phosphatase [Vibrio cidicii]
MEPITLEINQIRAVVFDLDNTLVTSSLDFVSMRQALGCPEQEDLLSFVDKLPDAAQRAHAQHIILQHEMADAQSSTPLPGCHALLAFIKQRAWRCAIVTRNCLAASELKLAHNDIEVEKLITREHCAPKPDPEALLQLADEWQLRHHQVLYVGDYLYDLQAANNANMPSCLVSNAREKPYANQASITVARLDDLLSYLQTALTASAG